jgi:hypothetical protein
MRTIRITMSKDGTTRLEVLGDQGEHCLAFTAELERRLGTIIGERQYKAEFKEQEVETEREDEANR